MTEIGVPGGTTRTASAGGTPAPAIAVSPVRLAAPARFRSHAHHHMGRVRRHLRAASRAARRRGPRHGARALRARGPARRLRGADPARGCAAPASWRARAARKGGYALARPADEITVREILAAAELADVRPALRVAPGGRGALLGVARVQHPAGVDDAAATIDEVLEGVRLSDLLEAEPKVRQRVGLPVLHALSVLLPADHRSGARRASASARRSRTSPRVRREPDEADVEWLAEVAARGDARPRALGAAVRAPGARRCSRRSAMRSTTGRDRTSRAALGEALATAIRGVDPTDAGTGRAGS